MVNAGDDSAQMSGGSTTTINVLANDTAGQGASFNCALLTITQPPAGQGVVTKENCTGATCTTCVLKYDPGVYVGPTSFTYKIVNSVGCEDTATVDVTVNPLPNAENDSAQLCAGSTTTINVLANDTAGQGASFNCALLTITQPPAGQGVVTKESCSGATCTTCVLKYDPGVYVGPTSFTYKIVNSVGCEDTATVDVTVNPLPNAENDSAQLCAGSTTTINVLANDTAGQGASFNCALLTITQPPAGQGVVTKESCSGATCTTCVLKYDPGVYVGPTSFTYKIVNSVGCEDTATVDVTVNPLPNAENDSAQLCAGSTTTINVLANDTAGQGASFNCALLTITQPPAGQGVVTKESCSGATCTTCVLKYDPGVYVGPTSFTYKIVNSVGCEDTATVDVTVNPLPNAENDSAQLCAGSTTTINVLANDTAGQGASFNCALLTITQPPAGQGVVTKESCSGATCTTCVLKYDPGVYVGPTSFTYKIVNSVGCEDTATVDVTVNPLPNAENDSAQLCAGSTTTINVLANDTAGQGASFNCALLTITQPPAGQGVVTKESCSGATCTTCVLKYDPGVYVGPTSFTYKIVNSVGCEDTATVDVTVNPLPNAENDSAQLCAGSTTTINVLANDTAGQGASFNCALLTITQPPAGQGVVTKESCSGATCTTCVLKYDPGVYVGPTSFTYKIVNSVGCEDTATVDVTVNPLPNAENDSAQLCAGSTTTINVLANDTAGQGASFNCALLTITQPPAGQGVVTKESCSGATCTTCVLKYDPGVYVGPTSFTYKIVNSVGCEDTATVDVTVNPLPNAENDSAQLCAGSTTTINVLANDTAGQGASFNCALLTITQPPAGQGVVTKESCSGATCTTCVLKYDPGVYVGPTSFTYKIVNSVGCEDTATVDVTVNPLPNAENDSAQLCSGSTTTINVLANDTAGQGASFNCALLTITQPPAGQGVVTKENCTGATCTTCVLKYDPGVYVGPTSFTYKLVNSVGCDDTAIVNVTVNPLPNAVNDSAQLCSGSTTTINVLANDTAGQGASFNCALLTVTQPPAGQGVVTKENCTGATCTTCVLKYDPGVYVGPTSFTYKLVNSVGCEDTATVSLRVCRPQAVPDRNIQVCQGGSV